MFYLAIYYSMRSKNCSRFLGHFVRYIINCLRIVMFLFLPLFLSFRFVSALSLHWPELPKQH